jgi:hypothetical protein
MKTLLRKSGAKSKVAPFIQRAERAFKRVAKQVEAEYRAKGIAPAVWDDEKPVRAKSSRRK